MDYSEAMSDEGTRPETVFLTSSIQYPFYRKRMIAFYELGMKFIAVGFNRELGYKSTRVPFTYRELEVATTRNFVIRMFNFMLFVPVLIKIINNKSIKVIYAFGIDMAFLSYIAKFMSKSKCIFVIEVHDIRELMTSRGITGLMARLLEKHVVTRSNLLIVTSEAYISSYYKEILGIKDIDWCLLENKLRKSEIRNDNSAYKKQRRDYIVIGYFGSLRCGYAWNALKNIVQESNGRIRVYVRGVTARLETFSSDIEEIEYITYGGPYIDPDNLDDVYSKCDIVWTAGFHEKSSYLWARSCRFYNALAFGKPLIAQVGTEDCKYISKYGAGVCIDLNNIDATIQRIESIEMCDIEKWMNNIKKLPESVYYYTNEHIEVMEKLGL